MYKTTLSFNKKQFVIFVKINSVDPSNEHYHYDIELRTKQKISGNEFQKLRQYLESEGYIDAAIEYYNKQIKNET